MGKNSTRVFVFCFVIMMAVASHAQLVHMQSKHAIVYYPHARTIWLGMGQHYEIAKHSPYLSLPTHAGLTTLLEYIQAHNIDKKTAMLIDSTFVVEHFNGLLIDQKRQFTADTSTSAVFTLCEHDDPSNLPLTMASPNTSSGIGNRFSWLDPNKLSLSILSTQGLSKQICQKQFKTALNNLRKQARSSFSNYTLNQNKLRAIEKKCLTADDVALLQKRASELMSESHIERVLIVAPLPIVRRRMRQKLEDPNQTFFDASEGFVFPIADYKTYYHSTEELFSFDFE